MKTSKNAHKLRREQILNSVEKWELFPFFPHTFQDDVFAIKYVSIAFPMKQFSFKFILRVIV